MNPSRWGPLASAITGLCCLGAAPVIAALSALGLGFLIRDALLIPLFTFFLGITLWGLHRDCDRHGLPWPERLGWLAALASLAGLWVSGIVVAVGLALLFAAAVWNALLVRRVTTRART